MHAPFDIAARCQLVDELCRPLPADVQVIRSADAVVHQLHGTSFTSYAAPSRGSAELCGWRIEVPPGTRGVPHRVSREEVLYVLSGSVRATVSDRADDAAAGDAIVVPTGSVISLSNPGEETAAAWVTTSAGFAGVLPDGSWFTPPWAR